MILRIAWKNIWRNRTRSIVVIASVTAGLWAGMFIIAFSWGMYKEHIQNSIEIRLAHIQIHHPQFRDEKLPELTVLNADKIISDLENDNRVKGVSPRSVVTGMINSPASAMGVSITGIYPESEKDVSLIYSKVTEGNYFESDKKNQILIGEELSKKLNIKLSQKVVLTFQDKNHEITAGAFRITGIYKSRNSRFDEMNVFVRNNDLMNLLNSNNEYQEIAIVLSDERNIESFADELRSSYQGVKIETWKQLAPELQLAIDSFNQYMYIFIGIILLALMFGIVNTMLMAVLERQHEIGMLMAIGMNKFRLFSMIVLETIMLVGVGIPTGILITHFSVWFFHNHGIDLSAFSEGMSEFGFGTFVRPEIDPGYYLPITLMTAFTAIISALFPARKALKLKPVEAIRKI